AQRLALVGNHEPVVDADGAAEAAALVAGAERRVEREPARRRLVVGEIAVRAVQPARVAPGAEHPGRIRGVDQVRIGAPAADPQRRLEGLEHAAALGGPDTQPVLHHLEGLLGCPWRLAARALAAGCGSGRGPGPEEARVTLPREELAHLR